MGGRRIGVCIDLIAFSSFQEGWVVQPESGAAGFTSLSFQFGSPDNSLTSLKKMIHWMLIR